jgi:hypothetical protein
VEASSRGTIYTFTMIHHGCELVVHKSIIREGGGGAQNLVLSHTKCANWATSMTVTRSWHSSTSCHHSLCQAIRLEFYPICFKNGECTEDFAMCLTTVRTWSFSRIPSTSASASSYTRCHGSTADESHRVLATLFSASKDDVDRGANVTSANRGVDPSPRR